MLSQVRKWTNLARRSCLLCRLEPAYVSGLCRLCYTGLPWNKWACRKCARPLRQAATNLICGACLATETPFERILCPLRYDYPVDKVLHNFKFNSALHFGRLLGDLLADHIATTLHHEPDYLVPVPLHENRLRERGFNHANELATRIAKNLNLPIKRNLCYRVKNTSYQTTLSAKRRRINLKNAFFAPECSSIKRIAIIEDVVTTGSTVTELAGTLRRAGIENIDIWCVARAE